MFLGGSGGEDFFAGEGVFSDGGGCHFVELSEISLDHGEVGFTEANFDEVINDVDGMARILDGTVPEGHVVTSEEVAIFEAATGKAFRKRDEGGVGIGNNENVSFVAGGVSNFNDVGFRRGVIFEDLRWELEGWELLANGIGDGPWEDVFNEIFEVARGVNSEGPRFMVRHKEWLVGNVGIPVEGILEYVLESKWNGEEQEDASSFLALFEFR